MSIKAIHVLSAVTLCLAVALPVAVGGGPPADKATGDVMGTPAAHPFRWYYLDFSAHEGETLLQGKGEVTLLRLDVDAQTVIREEHCEVLYVKVEGHSAWFAGPILYDSANVLPLRWIVVYVEDGGQPGAGNDALWWTRVADASEALEMVEQETLPATDVVVQAGNLTVHTR